MRIFSNSAELIAATGSEIGASDWHLIDQRRIDMFAETTGDHQWIHIDPDQARQGPYGATIAHGYLTLAMGPVLCGEIYRIDNVSRAVNYGLDRVRFLSPVIVGSELAARVTFDKVESIGPREVAVYSTVSFETKGGDRPACVASTIGRYYFK
ncbi:MaoC family dehydratase [Nocardioides endophyticus]|uniref:MaoC family dehydratase n=1 Tax=Nocardioides endophyticus TaxID=1353775 RepID=A0ABP8YHW2_9ACTN